MTDYEKAIYEKVKIGYKLFISVYPLSTDDLDGEEWRTIVGYEGLYAESNYGRTKSFYGGKSKILKPALHKGGYLYVNLYKNGKATPHTVHRLVARTFVENPFDKPEINHIDGVKFNCCAENLIWVTPSENQRHALTTGLRKMGEIHNTKLTNEQVAEIRKIYVPRDEKFGICALAKKFNMGRRAISDIVHNKSHKNV